MPLLVRLLDQEPELGAAPAGSEMPPVDGTVVGAVASLVRVATRRPRLLPLLLADAGRALARLLGRSPPAA